MLGGCYTVVSYTAQSWKHDLGVMGMKKQHRKARVGWAVITLMEGTYNTTPKLSMFIMYYTKGKELASFS